MTKPCIKLALLIGLCFPLVQADQLERYLDHEGESRSYLLYVPSSYQDNLQAPLLVVLHGRSGTAQRMADLTSFNSRAEKHGFVTVYPQGIRMRWNYLHGISGHSAHPNDSDFVIQIIDAINNEYSIDVKRIYVTGISNGGFMAQRLACYAPEKFAAFASVAAGGYGALAVECKNHAPVNLLYLHGTEDQKVPWKGLGIQDEDGNRQLVTMAIADSVRFWSNRNQCSPEVTRKDMPTSGNSPGTRVQVLSSNDCIGNAEVMLYAIVGGGHNWPGAPGIIPESIAGRVNMDFHASDAIWSFFSNKRLIR